MADPSALRTLLQRAVPERSSEISELLPANPSAGDVADAWEIVADERPELFGRRRRVPLLSGLGYAVLYSQVCEPDAFAYVQLEALERRDMRRTRDHLLSLVDLKAEWRSFRHIVFDDDRASALTATASALPKFFGGAFSDHPTL